MAYLYDIEEHDCCLDEGTKFRFISPLYPLEPIGLGTPLVEGFSSYITRLAEAHCISVVELLRVVYGQRTKGSYINPLKNTRNRACINGFGKSAADLLDKIMIRTTNQELSRLTFIKYSSLITGNGLMKYTKTWCPMCYKDFTDKNEDIYDPLIWSISFISHCPIHDIQLFDRCNHCGNENQIINYTSRPGFCDKCKNNLVYDEAMKVTFFKNDTEKMISHWFFNIFSELITNKQSIISREELENAYRTLLSEYCNDDVNELAELLKLNSSKKFLYKISKWERECIPSLNILLWTCFVLRSSLNSLLTTGRFNVIKILDASDISGLQSYFGIKYRQYIDKDEVSRQLQAFFDMPQYSSKSISKELGINCDTLRKAFPYEYRIISSNHKRYQKEKRDAIINFRFDEIEKVSKQYISRYNKIPSVRALSSDPWNLTYLRDSVYRNHLYNIRGQYIDYS
jgi:hypothetical protein